MYDFKETARIKDCEIGFESTHCHKNGNDEIAKIMYFFTISFDVSEEGEITLPDDSDIVIISAVATNATNAEIKTPLLEEVEERKFSYKRTLKEKWQYFNERRYKNMHDKKFYERKNWGKDY